MACVAEATVSWEAPPPSARTLDLTAIRARVADATDAEELYRLLGQHEISYGPGLRGLSRIAWTGEEALAWLGDSASHPRDASRPTHALLDAVLITCLAPLLGTGQEPGDPLFVSAGIGNVTVRKPLTEAALVYATVHADGGDAGSATAEAVVTSAEGEVLLDLTGVTLARLSQLPGAAVGAPARTVAGQANGGGAPGGSGPGRPLLAEVWSVPDSARRLAILEKLVRSSVASVVKLPPERVDPERPLRGFGLESVMWLELRNRLEKMIGSPLPATLIWNYPTIRDLVPYLAREAGIPLSGSVVGASEVNEENGNFSSYPERGVVASGGDGRDMINRELAELAAMIEDI